MMYFVFAQQPSFQCPPICTDGKRIMLKLRFNITDIVIERLRQIV